MFTTAWQSEHFMSWTQFPNSSPPPNIFTPLPISANFANMMVTAWYVFQPVFDIELILKTVPRTSGTNCARIYNTSISKTSLESSLPLDWQTTFQMDVDDVWNAFYMYSLCLDYYEWQAILELPHSAPSQA
jgi:hypothetical protein